MKMKPFEGRQLGSVGAEEEVAAFLLMRPSVFNLEPLSDGKTFTFFDPYIIDCMTAIGLPEAPCIFT